VNAQTVTQVFGSGAYSFSMEFVTIGNPNNVADTGQYSNQGSGEPYTAGSVSYVYNLGKYEISRDMVLKASTSGGFGLTLADMTSYGGNGGNRPATGISWNEAARFVNWLNTSKGYQSAYNFDGSGNFQLWGAGQYSGSNKYRHKNAYYFLPSRDEWYKGAYGSPSGNWYNYPEGSDGPPGGVSGGTSGAVWGRTSPADIDSAGGLSPYGTMAQGGNVWEWTETAFDGSNDSAIEQLEVRGGAWNSDDPVFGSYQLSASYRASGQDMSEDYLGFRVASIPEPSSLSLLVAGGAVLIMAKWIR